MKNDFGDRESGTRRDDSSLVAETIEIKHIERNDLSISSLLRCH